jgi:tight adherence protein B
MLPVVVGVAIVGMIGLLGLVFSGSGGTRAEQRLDEMAGQAGRKGAASAPQSSALLRPPTLQGAPGWLGRVFSSEGLARLYEQADVGLPFRVFLVIAAALAAVGAVAGFVLRTPPPMLPVLAASCGAVPFAWLVMRRKKRIKKFMAQMPDAMELIGRALRAGHGLASGLHVVAEEMPPPISLEFGRVYEEQNLGIPLEDALRGLSERVPTMDVRFFVTAVVIQRATGGDLAEVLDKIGHLIRERFQILGQVRALTGEGRISGVVLLAMPPALMAFVSMTNPSYIGLLFNTEIGKKMLIVTAVLQLVGAAAIKKIVTIKV